MASASEREPPPSTDPIQYTYRLGVSTTGDHGYEIGTWPADADLNDPTQFIVVAKCYGQEEALDISRALNAGQITPKAAAEMYAVQTLPAQAESAKVEEEAEEHPHRRTRGR